LIQPVAWNGCCGWLYTPPSEAPRREPVVFFGPVGTDDLCARHSLALLAHDLRQQGHTVLRFDWPGTGDSLGNLTDDGLWEQWLQAGDSAIQFLAQHTQSSSVAVLAHRLGALVALSVLQRRSSANGSHPAAGTTQVQHLALLAPVLQGKPYLRELKTLADPGADHLRILGLAWGESIQSALTQADVTTLPPPADLQTVLLATAQSSRGLTQWESLWQPALPVTRVPYGDLAAHIGNPLHNQHPTKLWSQMLQWGQSLPTHLAILRIEPTPPAALCGPGFTETATLIPTSMPMAGVWCRASASGQPMAQRPVVLMCNTGRTPHTGWGRDWVDLARTWAQAGIDSLRFDLPGWGDSPPMPNPPRAPLYSDELQPIYAEVVQWVASQQPVVLLGSCSSTYWAFRQARSDANVRGLVLVNIPAFDWPQGVRVEERTQPTTRSVEGYKKLAFQAETWKRLFSGQINLKPIVRKFATMAQSRLAQMGQRLQPHRSASADPGAWPTDPVTRTQEGFRRLAAHHTPVTVIYSADDEGRDVFSVPFGASGDGFTRLSPTHRLVVLDDADHMLSSPSARSALLNEVLRVALAVQASV